MSKEKPSKTTGQVPVCIVPATLSSAQSLKVLPVPKETVKSLLSVGSKGFKPLMELPYPGTF